MEDKIFRWAIILSVIVHAFFFWRFYQKRIRVERIQKETELSYQVSRPTPKEVEMEARRLEKSVADIAPISFPPVPPPIPKEVPLFKGPVGGAESLMVFDRQPEKIKGLKITREITIPALRSEKIDTPSYASYYQIVSDRIRYRAYANYTKLGEGDIFISFIVKSNGVVGEVQIIDDKSSANEFLRAEGLKSVREAGPFPAFPRDLNYPEIPFTITISFRYREG